MAGDQAEAAAGKQKVKKRKRSLSTGGAEVSPAAGKRQKVAAAEGTPKKAKKAKKEKKAKKAKKKSAGETLSTAFEPSTTPKSQKASNTPATPKTPKAKKAAPASTPLGVERKAKKAEKAPQTRPVGAATKKKKRRSSAQLTAVETGARQSVSCLSEKKVTLRLHLLPHTLQDTKQGILHVLMDFLLKYNTALGGVVLSFSDVVIPKKDAAILSDFAHMHFSLRCKMTVFTPALATYLHGVVSQVGFDHIGLLVFGNFNASIAADSMPSTYERDSEEDQWVCTEDPAVRLVRGSVIRFRVSGVYLASSGSFSIAGDLKAPDARPLGIIEEVPEVFHVEAMELDAEEAEEEDREGDAYGEADVQANADVEMVDAPAASSSSLKSSSASAGEKVKKSKIKKVKKQKGKDLAADTSPVTPKKKKRKKKKATSDTTATKE